MQDGLNFRLAKRPWFDASLISRTLERTETLQHIALDQLALQGEEQNRLHGAESAIHRRRCRARLAHYVEVLRDIRTADRPDFSRTELRHQMTVKNAFVADDGTRAPVSRLPFAEEHRGHLREHAPFNLCNVGSARDTGLLVAMASRTGRQLGLYVPAETAEKLKELSTRTDIPPSRLLRQALELLFTNYADILRELRSGKTKKKK